ncbi:heparan sulfate 2-O-sulfotransferase 1-like [Octopus sinensis]|uniref:Heparan sulfate 2-O-sulfotransferase 1-like n=1 Tax=Octopus sinensis TaxID=2607531 RepID=A0A7E6EGV0_9MOLL|nr:heparan sulfate 2-O-sulfotransferase 1-like [Octopus sinensis]
MTISKAQEELHPLNKDSLMKHMMRANYLAGVFHHYLEQIPEISPNGMELKEILQAYADDIALIAEPIVELEKKFQNRNGFAKFGVLKKPIFINVIRKPLDRLISYYYFVRNGDDFRPYLKRKKAGNKQTFDECVEENGEDCDPNNLWMQIPFFCGHAAECWVPGYRWALEQAKYNLVNNYLVVGVTEELGDFVAILEATLPRFFKGAVDLYNSGHKSHLRKTSNKIPPKESSLLKIQQSKVWKMEQEFYDFAVEQFHFIKQLTFDLVDGEYIEKGYQFIYEKIRPR